MLTGPYHFDTKRSKDIYAKIAKLKQRTTSLSSTSSLEFPTSPEDTRTTDVSRHAYNRNKNNLIPPNDQRKKLVCTPPTQLPPNILCELCKQPLGQSGLSLDKETYPSDAADITKSDTLVKSTMKAQHNGDQHTMIDINQLTENIDIKDGSKNDFYNYISKYVSSEIAPYINCAGEVQRTVNNKGWEPYASFMHRVKHFKYVFYVVGISPFHLPA